MCGDALSLQNTQRIQQPFPEGSHIVEGVVPAEGDADGPVDDLGRQAHGREHMAPMALGAGRPGGDADALAAEVIDNVLAGVARQGEGEDMGASAWPMN